MIVICCFLKPIVLFSFKIYFLILISISSSQCLNNMQLISQTPNLQVYVLQPSPIFIPEFVHLPTKKICIHYLITPFTFPLIRREKVVVVVISDAQWPVTDVERSDNGWSLIMMCIFYFHRDLWTEELAMKFALYAIFYS